MKGAYTFCAITVALLFCSLPARAQSTPPAGNVVVITRMEAALPADGTRREFDSLTTEYDKWVLSKNEYLISHKTVRHWWGSNNRDVVHIYEVKGWDEILKANERNDALFQAHWDTPEKRMAWNKLDQKYFTGKHSDEIYREVK